MTFWYFPNGDLVWEHDGDSCLRRVPFVKGGVVITSEQSHRVNVTLSREAHSHNVALLVDNVRVATLSSTCTPEDIAAALNAHLGPRRRVEVANLMRLFELAERDGVMHRALARYANSTAARYAARDVENTYEMYRRLQQNADYNARQLTIAMLGEELAENFMYHNIKLVVESRARRDISYHITNTGLLFVYSRSPGGSRKLCRICLVFKDYDIPALDLAMSLYTLAMSDEAFIWKQGNLLDYDYHDIPTLKGLRDSIPRFYKPNFFTRALRKIGSWLS